MSKTPASIAGRVVAIWRYPVKSMLGEELSAADVTEHGLLGDRAFALIDAETGKVASAKNPRRWPNLLDFRAAFIEPPRDAASLAPVRITPPSGEPLTAGHAGAAAQANTDQQLSAAVGRPVCLARFPGQQAVAEGYWPDHDWLPQRDEVFEFELPPGTFFDGAAVHLITTATLDHLSSLAPASRFEALRFRPNFVIETAGDQGFVENGWVGRTLTLGGVQLRIERPCPRCVMTTVSQGGLPKDPGVLRAAVEKNAGNVGVYATVVRAGHVCCGEAAALS
jgi:uncharacterized protein YcbX